MTPLRIKVAGSATVSCPAERAILHLTVRAEGPSREQVSTDVANTSDQVRSMFKDLAGKDSEGRALASAAVTHWSNSTLSTGYQPSYRNGDPDPRYSASMSFEAKFQDFAQLGDVTTTLSTMERVTVGNIDWQLTSATKDKFISQCRQSAVHDAIGKARDYAAALDKPIPPVVEITDVEQSYGGYSSAMTHGAQRAAPVLTFQPKHVSIESAVTVTFEGE